jgi:hypothetical protein
MSDREAQHALLNHPRQLVGHLRLATLSRPQHLQAVTVDLALPVVVVERCTPNVRHAADTELRRASANSCRR